MAATNRPDMLDPALLRPGRFDRQIVVDMPDAKGREQILKVHTRKIPLAADVDLTTIARGTSGLSGADLANIVNEAALLAARRNKTRVAMQDFEDAKDKVMLGVERKSVVLSDEDKKIVAYHEAGHALVNMKIAYLDPVHKVTIIPRGQALGVTASLPEEDRYNLTREYILGKLAAAYGGRAAEKIVFGFDKVTTGAAQDIVFASNLARRAVTEYGMSEVVGPIAISERQGKFLGDDRMVEYQPLSEATARLVENIRTLHKLAQALLEKETLTRDDINRILNSEEN